MITLLNLIYISLHTVGPKDGSADFEPHDAHKDAPDSSMASSRGQ